MGSFIPPWPGAGAPEAGVVPGAGAEEGEGAPVEAGAAPGAACEGGTRFGGS